ncbi:MAG: 3'-5' exonuclease [Zetaproteobacteria bacterium]|nr:3'-5' exonuclease [Zetaproteobacteria bacterium]
MRHDTIVFDIETIPDAEASKRLLNQPELKTLAARDALGEYFLERTGGKSDFPRQPFHQIVAISYAHLVHEKGENGHEIILKQITSGGETSSDEKALLERFFHIIESRAPQLVSYNGRGFDIPVLKYRAMVHEISCPRWFSEGDKWNNYDTRYSSTYHLDLLEAFSDYGASARCSLHEVATTFQIPGKLDTAGDQVRAMFEAGNIAAIRNYCETDVCSTLLLYLRWQRFNGGLSEPAYSRAMLGLFHYLQHESETRPHLLEFLHQWQQLSKIAEGDSL